MGKMGNVKVKVENSKPELKVQNYRQILDRITGLTKREVLGYYVAG
jgi:hypothetical protein